MKAPWIFLLMAPLIVAGCTNTTVNEHRESITSLHMDDSEKLVLLGRRHAGRYETEPDFIDCIGDQLRDGTRVQVMDEAAFIDDFYPWFEPRTAPLKLRRMQYIMNDPLLADKIHASGVRYMIWVDGNTETTDKEGNVSCAVGPGGAGCFGFATWDKASNYEAIVWDLKDFSDKGRVRVDASGSSYMIAVGAPIPFIARVQSQACQGLGNQLKAFFDSNSGN